MECDPSPSRHQHRQRYHQPAPLLNYGPTSLQYAPYPGPITDSTAPKHNSTTANGPQPSNKANDRDRDDSPMVGVCVQHNSVAIH